MARLFVWYARGRPRVRCAGGPEEIALPFNPARFHIARKRRLLNKKALAELAACATYGCPLGEGRTEPTAEHVQAFARVLDFPGEFLFGPDVDEPDSASFRSHTSMSAAVRDAALAAGTIGFMISDWVEERFDLPTIQVPDLHLYEPE